MASRCRAKRPRCYSDDESPPLNLLAAYQSDVGWKILSYASANDLCTLDILNKQFQSLTTNAWENIAKERFGMNNGKKGWRIGVSFLEEPKFIHVPDADEDLEEFEEGGRLRRAEQTISKVAANKSIIVATLNNTDNNLLEIRDASNLETIRKEESPLKGRITNLALCGQVGSEIIVTSNKRHICAQSWKRNSLSLSENGVQKFKCNSNEHPYVLIGSETHLVVASTGRIRIYEVNPDVKGHIAIANPVHPTEEELSLLRGDLLVKRKSIRVKEGAMNEYGALNRSIAWGSSDKTHFIIGYSQQICVWKFNMRRNRASLVNTITVSEFEVYNVALADDYIVASSRDKDIHIWNRNTGVKMVYESQRLGAEGPVTLHSLCDDSRDDNDDGYEYNGRFYFARPLYFSCHGHLLVSTAQVGGILCIWNMKTGQKLKRYNDRYFNYSDEAETLPPYIEDTDMVYLEHMNAILCMRGHMNLWTFPTNDTQDDMANSCKSLYYSSDEDSSSEEEDK